MGRPKEHNEWTAAALLHAAERTVEAHGIEAVSVRGLSEELGVTTRAVYSLFGSKEGLLVALAAYGFTVLNEIVRSMPRTNRPDQDLVACGAVGFRRFALEHPALFRLAIQRHLPGDLVLAEPVVEARDIAFGTLVERVQRVKDADLLHGRSAHDAAVEFHALCEGLASVELRRQSMIPRDDGERVWRDAFTVLVAGFAVTPPARRRR